jgi:hypothetical protein
MLQENKPELPFILIGCMAAAVNGCTMPAFAIFFSEMIKVCIFPLLFHLYNDDCLIHLLYFYKIIHVIMVSF